MYMKNYPLAENHLIFINSLMFGDQFKNQFIDRLN